MASNTSATLPSSPLQSCKLHPQPPLLPSIMSDNVLAIILPTIVYAIAGGFFHLLDTFQLFSRYRIHPSQVESKRNRVTRSECLRGVIRYHIMQISTGLLLNMGNGPTMIGDESCKINKYASVISRGRKIIPLALAATGIDVKRLIVSVHSPHTGLVQLLHGSPDLPSSPTGFTPLEISFAKLTHHILIPLSQYTVALAIVDTWIYFAHRLCHSPPFYKLVHAQHHRLYVSYAYGAVYGHWLETIFLDIVSFVLAGEIAQLAPRQSMLFGTFATIKAISDHSGYVFPWDPFRLVNDNGARFHDLHHQTWGLKYNFGTYTVFWDRMLGTSWRDEKAAEEKYWRARRVEAKRNGGGMGKAVGVADGPED